MPVSDNSDLTCDNKRLHTCAVLMIPDPSDTSEVIMHLHSGL